jgi:hypothetical protein
MTDLERRLRAALVTAVEPPPGGLMDGIRRRHRRYLLRLRAASAAVAAVVLVGGSLAAHGALSGSAGPGQAGPGPAVAGGKSGPPVVIPSASPTGVPAAVPGTVLRDCQNSTGGTVSANWKSQSVHAGPVWFIFGRLADSHPGSRRLPDRKLSASAMAIAVSNGQTAVVTVAPQAAGDFRFLDGFNNSDAYTLREGEPGLTLVGCPKGPPGQDIPAGYAPGLTMSWQGYITDLTGCVPLQVQALPGGQKTSVTLQLSGGSCSS